MMANIKKCDRCGKIYEKNKKFNGLSLLTKDPVFINGIDFSISYYGYTGHMDLCDDCLTAVRDFLILDNKI